MRSILLNWIYKQRKSVLWRELSPECETCISQTNKLNSCQIIWKPHPCFGRCKSLQCCNFQKDTTVWGRSSTVPKCTLQTRSPSQNSLPWLIHSVPGPLMGPFVSVGELAPITCSSIGGCGMLPAISKLLLQWPQQTPTDLHARASILGGWVNSQHRANPTTTMHRAKLCYAGPDHRQWGQVKKQQWTTTAWVQ